MPQTLTIEELAQRRPEFLLEDLAKLRPELLDELLPPPPEVVAEALAATENMVTEDDTPVDNFYSEKQMRLLTEPLYASWNGQADPAAAPRPFLAAANVALYGAVNQPIVVPDALLSLDAQVPEEIWKKYGRSYFTWIIGKTPEVVIEIVSNRAGEEDTTKIRTYARIGVDYYVIYDPQRLLDSKALRIFELRSKRYRPRAEAHLPEVGLGLTLWSGTYEGFFAAWLRWCDQQGNLILTGAERAEQEAKRAEQEAKRAEQEAKRAEQEAKRAKQEAKRAKQEAKRAEQALAEKERLAAKLRELGIDPTRL